MPTTLDIRPQPGPQEKFISSPADIVVYGGGAGGGKSYALLLEPLRHVHRRGFGGVIFRRTFPQITNEGGLWDTSEKIYPHTGAVSKSYPPEWHWPDSDVSISFAHLQHEKDKLSWQGAALPFIGFDELTHFSRGMFFYLLSRNRLTNACGVRPYIRATCNPEPDGWVADFLSWWIDQETGFPIPERDGVLRWFARRNDDLEWSDTRDALIDPTMPNVRPKSVTFIRSLVSDNPALLAQDPEYLSTLHALPRFERLQLLDGNWKIRPVAGMFFQRAWFKIVAAAPAGSRTVRYWDRASSEATARTDPDYTVGVKMTRSADDFYYVTDVQRFRCRPNEVKNRIVATATQDGPECQVWLEQDPGQAGVVEVQMLARALAGFPVYANKVTKSKITRALPYSAQCEAGNVLIVRAPWNETYLSELESFADEDQLPDELRAASGAKKDQVDASSGAFNVLCTSSNPRLA